MTDREFWTAVAARLVLRRHELGVRSPNAVRSRGGPTYKTVQQIEAGNIGQIDKLTAYAAALKMSVVDLFGSVLAVQREPNPDLEMIIRKYERADPEGRNAIAGVARAVRELPPEAGTQTGQPSQRPSRPPEARAIQKRPKRRH